MCNLTCDAWTGIHHGGVKLCMTVPSHMGSAFYGDIEAWHVSRSKLLPCQACAVGGGEVPQQQNPQETGSEWCRS